jgi:hypothetical protein
MKRLTLAALLAAAFAFAVPAATSAAPLVPYRFMVNPVPIAPTGTLTPGEQITPSIAVDAHSGKAGHFLGIWYAEVRLTAAGKVVTTGPFVGTAEVFGPVLARNGVWTEIETDASGQALALYTAGSTTKHVTEGFEVRGGGGSAIDWYTY